MIKITRCFSGFLLVMMWSLTLPLNAAEPPQPDAPPASPEMTSGIDGALRAAQEEIRDPFAIAPETEAAVVAPAPAAARPEVTVVLQGLGFGSKDAYAVMGGDVYYIGDEKNGVKLLEVRRREVDILVNGGRITIPLFPGSELQKARERAAKKRAVKNAPGAQQTEESLSSSEREPLPL